MVLDFYSPKCHEMARKQVSFKKKEAVVARECRSYMC